MRHAMVLLVFLAGVLVFGSAQAAPDLALILNGNDNTLSTVELGPGTSHPGVSTFPGYPGHGAMESGRYYAVVSGADRVMVFDAWTLAPMDTLFPGTGSNPFAVTGDGNGNVFVSLLNAGEVVRYDATGSETGRVAVGRSPEGLVVHHGRLFVANTGFRLSDYGYDPGTVSVLDPVLLTPLGTIPVGTNPQWPAAFGSTVQVVCTGDYFSVFGEVHIADAATLAPVDTVVVGGSPGFLVTGGGRGYATDYFGGIFVYDASTGAVVHDAGSPLQFGGSGYSALAWDDSGYLYVTLYDDDAVAKLRVSDETVIDAFSTGDGPGSIVLRAEEAVPVRLVRFEAAARGRSVALYWVVAEDDAVAGFTIDRRDPTAAVWARAGSAGAGARGFQDLAPQPGTYVYRLTAHLRDGSRKVLGESRVVVGQPALAVRALANPARGRLALRTEGAAPGPLSVTLLDASGRVLLAEPEAGESLTLSLGSVPAGVYFVRVAQSGRIATTRVTVVR